MSVITRASEILKYEGLKSTLWRGAKWVRSRSNTFEVAPLAGVFARDVLAVDWTKPRTFAAEPLVADSGRPQIGWVISPPSKTSGGHQNAYRFMKYLEDAGYDITLFLYSAAKYPHFTVDGVKHTLASNSAYPQLNAEYRMYDPEQGIAGDFDVIVATDWATAYAAWRYERNVPRVYWVQDFEPYFFPLGPDYVLAENSYRFGYHGITVGPWLSGKLKADYGMPSDFYDYAVDSALYQRTNDARRTGVVFYARPATPRRATEFGLLVLDEVARRRPDITIHMAGWDMSKAGIRFPFVNHGSMSIKDLPALYNECAVGFSLSMTCVSLFPLEVMACGAVPIVNDGDNTRVSLDNNPNVDFVTMSPGMMADRIIAAVDRPDQVEHSRAIAQSVAGDSWGNSGEHVVGIFNALLRR